MISDQVELVVGGPGQEPMTRPDSPGDRLVALVRDGAHGDAVGVGDTDVLDGPQVRVDRDHLAALEGAVDGDGGFVVDQALDGAECAVQPGDVVVGSLGVERAVLGEDGEPSLGTPCGMGHVGLVGQADEKLVDVTLAGRQCAQELAGAEVLGSLGHFDDDALRRGRRCGGGLRRDAVTHCPQAVDHRHGDIEPLVVLAGQRGADPVEDLDGHRDAAREGVDVVVTKGLDQCGLDRCVQRVVCRQVADVLAGRFVCSGHTGPPCCRCAGA